MHKKYSCSLRMAGLAVSLGMLSACSQIEGDGLFSDMQASLCPPGCTDSLKADDNQIVIKIANSTEILAAATSRVDIGGECYASLYPKNAIFVSVQNSSGADVFPARSYFGFNTETLTTQCNNGRFDIVVDMGVLTGTNTIRVQIVGYDDDGAQHVNESEGVSFVTVRRASP